MKLNKWNVGLFLWIMTVGTFGGLYRGINNLTDVTTGACMSAIVLSIFIIISLLDAGFQFVNPGISCLCQLTSYGVNLESRTMK